MAKEPQTVEAMFAEFDRAAVADAFCASRLAGEGGAAFGTLPAGLELAPIIDRATPKLG